MAKSTKKRAIIYSNVKENKKLAEEKQKIMQNQINLDDEVIIGFNNSKKTTKQKNSVGNKKKKKQKNNAPTKSNNNEQIRRQQNTTNKIKKNNKAKINPQKRKKMMLIIRTMIVISIIIISIIVFLKSSIFNIKDIVISVENNCALTESQINELSHIYVGQNMFSINKKESIQSLKSNPYIESVKISRKIPSQINISIVEREIKFQLQNESDGESYIYIDKHGYAVDKSNEKKDGFVVTGYKTKEIRYGEKLEDEDLEGLTIVMQITGEAQANGIMDSISKIDISDHEDYLIYFESQGKIAHLGDASLLNSKMARIKKIMQIEQDYAGEIFVNVDLNNGEDSYFRESV